MKNKRADFTIVLLVIMVLVLTAGALFIFNINTNKIGVKIVGARVLDEVYIIENEINFNLNRIMGKAIIGIDKQGDVVEIKQQFIVNFKSELETYLGEDGEYVIEELSQVEEQIDKSGFGDKVYVSLIEGEIGKTHKISLEFSFVVRQNFGEKLKNSYSYNKRFEKDL